MLTDGFNGPSPSSQGLDRKSFSAGPSFLSRGKDGWCEHGQPFSLLSCQQAKVPRQTPASDRALRHLG
jgi:hypothetical protein